MSELQMTTLEKGAGCGSRLSKDMMSLHRPGGILYLSSLWDKLEGYKYAEFQSIKDSHDIIIKLSASPSMNGYIINKHTQDEAKIKIQGIVKRLGLRYGRYKIEWIDKETIRWIIDGSHP